MSEFTANTREETLHMDLDPQVATTPTIQKKDNNRIGFGDLPAEVRNRIYELALTRSRNLRLLRKEYEGGMVLNSTRIFPSILRTCRKINAEATPVLYGDNAFQLYSCREFIRFLHSIGGSVRYIRSVEITHGEYGGWDLEDSLRQRDLNTLRRARALRRFGIVIECDRGHEYGRPVSKIKRVLLEIRDEQRNDGKEEVLEIVEKDSL